MRVPDISTPLSVALFYRPTDNDNRIYALQLVNAKECLVIEHLKYVVWTGVDTSLPDIDWTFNSITGK